MNQPWLDYILVSSAILDLNLSRLNNGRTGFAALGYSTNDFWNGYQTFGLANTGPWTAYWSGSGGQLTNYSTVTVTNGNTRQVNGLSDGMYGYFLYHLGGGGVSMTVTISNILTSGSADNYYDVYVYGHGASTDNGENTIVSAATYLYPTALTSYGTRGTTIWGNGWSNTVWEVGQQFVRFHNVDIKKNATNSAAFSALQITVSPNVYGYAEIAGIQLVPTSAIPAPSNSISSLINVGFGATNGSKTGLAALGITTGDFWNEFHHPGVSNLITVTNLLWSDSNASPVSMTVSNAPGEGNNGAGDGMYGPYSYQYGGSIPITFTNLANGIYDFYVYGHSPSNSSGSVFQLTSGTNVFAGKGTTVWDASWNSTNWDESMQYVIYRSVPVMTNGLITLTVRPGTNYAIINGIQINLPSPAADTDSNLDGIPDWWCLQYGLNPHTAGLASTTAPDGLTYLLHYLQGRNPIAGGTLDTNNSLGLTVYTPLK